MMKRLILFRVTNCTYKGQILHSPIQTPSHQAGGNEPPVNSFEGREELIV
jgi:hypothetical protein